MHYLFKFKVCTALSWTATRLGRLLRSWTYIYIVLVPLGACYDRGTSFFGGNGFEMTGLLITRNRKNKNKTILWVDFFYNCFLRTWDWSSGSTFFLTPSKNHFRMGQRAFQVTTLRKYMSHLHAGYRSSSVYLVLCIRDVTKYSPRHIQKPAMLL